MAHLIHALSHWVLHSFARHRYPILFFLVLIEEAGVPIPIPGDSLVMIAGGQAHKTFAYSFAIIALSSLAVFLGSSLLYIVSRRGGRALLARYGKYMRLHPQRLERMERWFQRRGPLAIIFGRLIPGLRIPTTIIAGLSDISYRVYAPTAAIAAVIWSLFYFFVGALIQREWGVVTGVVTGLLDETSDYIVVIWILLILLSIGFGGWHVTRRVRRRRLRQHLHLPHHQRPRADALSEADGTGR
jgi:membrane protein DedA with SNARE-associated domain